MVRKLYLCPPETPEAVITRCVHVPASQQWLAVYNRALLLLADPAQWEQVNETDITPEEAAATAYQIYGEWLSGECSLDCNDVLACVQTVIEDIIAGGTINVNVIDPSDTEVIETRFPTASRNAGILPDPVGCNKDELWSGILEIVTRIDDNGRDFWETVVAETDTIERIAEIIALVPLFGDIIGEGLELLADIAPTMRDKYLAFSSATVIEETACDLFQLVCAECRYPTYQEVYDYYAGLSAIGEEHWEELAFEALIDILLGTESSANAIVYWTTNIVQLWVLAALSTWLRTIGVKFIALWAKLGAADPSDNWEILCGECGEEPSPCDGVMDQLGVQFGTTYEAAEGNECLLHCTSGPKQGDNSYYVSLNTNPAGDGQNFTIDISNESGLSLHGCYWAVDGGASHYTNITGLEACSAMDRFYIRSNTPFTCDVTFTKA